MAKAPLIWLPLNGDLTNNGIRKTSVVSSGANNNFNYYGPIGKCWCSYSGTAAPTSSTVPGFIATGLALNTFPTEDITCSIWVKFPRAHLQSWLESGTYVIDTTYSTPQTTIIGYGNTSAGGVGIVAYYQTVTSGVLNFTGVGVGAYCRGGSNAAATSTVTISLDTWHHLASTYSTKTKTIKMYIDGALVKEAEWTGSGWNNITTDMRLNYSNVWAGNGKGVAAPVWLSDARVYNDVLSDKEIYDLAKGLVLHYTLDLSTREYANKNLVMNSLGKFGTKDWKSTTTSTDIPDIAEIECSYTNCTTQLMRINKNDTYKIETYIKTTNTSTNYPSIRFYDIDKKVIDHYMTPGYFHSTARTTLAQPLKKGDTIVYCTDLTNFTADPNWYIYLAVFGYKDSTGYVYPDFTYTRDALQFWNNNSTTKTNLDKTNNTITLLAPYQGEERSAGTAVCQATQGGWWLYPFGGLNASNNAEWTYKTYSFIPANTSWGAYAQYMDYTCVNGIYNAGLKITNTSATNSIVSNEAGYREYTATLRAFDSTINSGPSTSLDTPRYSECLYLNNSSDLRTEYRPIIGTSNFSVSLWLYMPTCTTGTYKAIFSSKYVNAASAGLGLYWNVTQNKLLWSTADGTTANEIYTTTTLNNIIYDKWCHIVMVRNEQDPNHGYFYINGVRYNLASVPSILDLNTSSDVLHISHLSSYRDYKGNFKISDFRFYTTALTADDVKNLYNTTASLDDKNNLHGLLLKEQQQNVMWQSSLALSRQLDSCLRRYTQSSCSVTHTPQGAHIVRTPNIAWDGSTSNGTYGGIVFRNSTVNGAHIWNSNTDNIWNLQKNHRYLFVCHLKGYSANNLGWISTSNNVGWSSGGLPPVGQVNASYYGPSLAEAGAAGIDSDIWLDFTITDDIVKTCTTSYSSFVVGNKYLSYMEIGVGFTYGATGELGTDIYVSNPRLYDITNLNRNNFYANGTINFSQFIENNNLESISITHGNEILTNSIIER